MDLLLPVALVDALVGPLVPVVHRVLQRVLRVDRGRWTLVRRVPGQDEGDALALTNGELADGAHVLAAVLDRSPETERVRSGNRDA